MKSVCVAANSISMGEIYIQKKYVYIQYVVWCYCKWHDVETCSSVIICEIIVHLLVTVQNNKRRTVQVLKYWCNLARYWLQAVWGWHDSVETCSSVIICEIIVYLLVIVQHNNKNPRPSFPTDPKHSVTLTTASPPSLPNYSLSPYHTLPYNSAIDETLQNNQTIKQ